MLESILTASDTERWVKFANQPHDEKWIKFDDLRLGDFKKAIKMCKGCAVTIDEMMEIVQDISTKFNLSPKDSFDLFKFHGKDKF